MDINNLKVGFIGAGNMATAIIEGLLGSEKIKAQNIYASDTDIIKLDQLAKKGVNALADNKYVVDNSDIIIIAVKPNVYPAILNEISQIGSIATKILVSIAPGISISFIKGFFKENIKVIRTMPNTPALIREGMTVTCYETPVTEVEYKIVNDIFATVGKVEEISEGLMNEVVAVNGSSPAYVYIMIEAMADAAVMRGIPRELSYRLSAQSVAGAAKMVYETGIHPGTLKDMVCSPGGTTIQAVSQLEKSGFRTAIIEAMEKCTEKAIELGKK